MIFSIYSFHVSRIDSIDLHFKLSSIYLAGIKVFRASECFTFNITVRAESCFVLFNCFQANIIEKFHFLEEVELIINLKCYAFCHFGFMYYVSTLVFLGENPIRRVGAMVP